MQVVVYFFSLWLLLLSGLPCPDAECHARENTTTTTSASHSADDHDHEAPCSPFCHCATCLGFSIPQPFSYARPAKPIDVNASRQIFAYHSPDQADVVQTVWQPPKL